MIKWRFQGRAAVERWQKNFGKMETNTIWNLTTVQWIKMGISVVEVMMTLVNLPLTEDGTIPIWSSQNNISDNMQFIIVDLLMIKALSAKEGGRFREIALENKN